MSHITEPEKQVPVVFEADVAVAGAGVSGVFAAIAAARHGARTVLVDRFGWVGGNIGPGYIAGGGMFPGRPHWRAAYSQTVYPGPCSIMREFLDRYAELGGTSLQPYSGRADYANDVHMASMVGHTMLAEAGVDLLLSTQIADPVMQDGAVAGLFVENKSGRQAVTARVVVDATGEADVARRAGAPILYPKTSYHEIDPHAPTGMGVYYLVCGVDWERYEAAVAAPAAAQDIAWAEEILGAAHAGSYRNWLPYLRRAYDRGETLAHAFVSLGGTRVPVLMGQPQWKGTPGAVHGRTQPGRVEELDAANGLHISALEAGIRLHIIEMARFWRRYVPGFEQSSLAVIAPFLGSRGGPCIEGEVTLTMEDCLLPRRFPDVTYLYGDGRALKRTCEEGRPAWVDVPYRVMVPKRLDGLLATGRSASCIPDTLLRNRMAVMVMGEVTGIAAALSAKAGVRPRDLDVRVLQWALLDTGFHLGDRHRLKELGLV